MADALEWPPHARGMQDERSALITGAGRGLGRALALRLAARGWRVVLVARTNSELEETARRIRAADGEAHTIVADVGDVREVPRIVAIATEAVGDVQLVVHAASDLGPLPMALLADTDPNALRRVFDVNVVGPFALTRALLPGLLLGEGGTIVQVSSDAAVEAYPTWGAYSASKAAADHLVRIWAAELADVGVRFFSVDPGEMNTKMHADAIPDADPASLADPDDVAAKIVAMIEAPASSGARLVASQWEAQR
jgi:NAD(P)-dependent dehydrogenase (short-subunit alcohol dehydrogenase family)